MRAPGVSSMALAVLIAGIVAFLAGLLAMVYGIPIREFSVGSTFILVGALGVCTGMLLTALFVVLTELKTIGRRLTGATAPPDVRARPVLPGIPASGMTTSEPASADTVKLEAALPPSPPAPPWQDEAAARPRAEAPPMPAVEPESPRRRNLMFESTSRKERERAQSKTGEGLPLELSPAVPAQAVPPEPPAANFDDAWPKPERMRPPEPVRRPPPPPAAPPRMPTASESPPAPAATPAPPTAQPAVTVLKSGVVDGMAYSLYSDGSIEAQMPEGMMRFASIDELRSHLDQRS